MLLSWRAQHVDAFLSKNRTGFSCAARGRRDLPRAAAPTPVTATDASKPTTPGSSCVHCEVGAFHTSLVRRQRIWCIAFVHLSLPKSFTMHVPFAAPTTQAHRILYVNNASHRNVQRLLTYSCSRSSKDPVCKAHIAPPIDTRHTAMSNMQTVSTPQRSGALAPPSAPPYPPCPLALARPLKTAFW